MIKLLRLSPPRSYPRPFVAVHHLEAHALLARKPFDLSLSTAAESLAHAGGGSSSGEGDEVSLGFPFLGLLVSGGHCQLLLCEGVGRYAVLGGTVDDALGEAYDKVRGKDGF